MDTRHSGEDWGMPVFVEVVEQDKYWAALDGPGLIVPVAGRAMKNTHDVAWRRNHVLYSGVPNMWLRNR
jgi:hypothetical protein